MRLSLLMISFVLMTPCALFAEPQPELHSVELKFVGGEKEEALQGVQLLVTKGYGSDQKKFGPYVLNEDGAATVQLPQGFFHLHLSSEKEWPYLRVEKLWEKRERGLTPDMSVYITEAGVAKWLDGKPQPKDYTAPEHPGGAPRLIYRLLPACRLTLRAVDAETGEGVPGVTFWMENAAGEDWAHFIDSENLGAKPVTGTEEQRIQGNLTTEDGYFRRLVGANAGYTYGVGIVPEGYELVEPRAEVKIDVVYGQARAEQVFKFRRK